MTARILIRAALQVVKLAFPGQNAEIMARGILIEEAASLWDSSPIDISGKVE